MISAAATPASRDESRVAIRDSIKAIQPSSRSGTSVPAIISATGWPKIGRAVITSSASGSSTSRDQCTGAPSGGFIRYWVVSNQLCPARKSRNCVSRSWSSGSHPDNVTISVQPDQIKAADTSNHNPPSSKEGGPSRLSEPSDAIICGPSKCGTVPSEVARQACRTDRRGLALPSFLGGPCLDRKQIPEQRRTPQ